MTTPSSYLYQEIAESIRRRIAAGELGFGERLPSMRDLAVQWDCTPGTVSRAYSLLAEEGLVVAHRGSGTQVAPSGLQPGAGTWQWAQLINRAEQFLLSGLAQGHTATEIQAALSVAVSRWHAYQGGDPARFHPAPQRPTGPNLRFAGSHDLIVELLASLLGESNTGARMVLDFRGSLGGLIALARDECDVAGTHLWDGSTDVYNEPFVRRILPGRSVALITLVHRSLGLVMRRGYAHDVRGIVDLQNSGLTIVNRQPGSGTRVWFDAQLEVLEIDVDDISGYEREVATHTDVARSVAEGTATAGIAIGSAAAAFDLDFVPLTRERYDLACTMPIWESTAMVALYELINSPKFKETVHALGGYGTGATGQVTWL